jgi:ABC-type glycerol-3-phosphate transport system permease component
MAPLIRPVIATVAILEFMSSWNEYMWAFVSLRDADGQGVQLGVVDLASKVYTYGYNTTFAAMVMTALPVIIGFIIAQRSFVKALTSGAVKG